MVNGHDSRLRRAPRPDRARPTIRVRVRAGAARRDRAHPGAGRAPGRRAQPDGRRPARRRLAGQRRDPAAGGRRPGALGAPVHRRRAPTPTSWSPRGTLTPELRDLLAEAVARAPQPARLRRHRLGQDDAAERALGLDRPGRAGGDDRGRRRAAPAPAARGPAREPAGLGRGPRRGDDPRPAAQRAADAARPDRDRRGPRRRGARPADRAQHRPRRARSRPCTPTRPRTRCGGSRPWR